LFVRAVQEVTIRYRGIIQMRNWLIGTMTGHATAGIALLWLVATVTLGEVQGQRQAPYRAPRTEDGRPNLNGIWQAMNTANWDIEAHGAQMAPYPELVGTYLAQPGGLSVVEGGTIPYKPEALARRKENFQKRLTIDPYNRDQGDPEAKCFLPGVPRVTYMPFPFQIVQGPDQIWITYEFGSATRFIPLRKRVPAPVDSWMGQSEGRWDGETLVVDVTGQNGKSWFDRAGNFMSIATHVVERYTAISPDALMYEATIEDPSLYTRPWKLGMPLYRRLEEDKRLIEFKCITFSEPILYHTLVKQPSK
jgi:hypothetical protein